MIATALYLAASALWSASALVGRRWPAAAMRIDRWATDLEDRAEDHQ